MTNKLINERVSERTFDGRFIFSKIESDGIS